MGRGSRDSHCSAHPLSRPCRRRTTHWGHSSTDRASGCRPEGCGFELRWPRSRSRSSASGARAVSAHLAPEVRRRSWKKVPRHPVCYLDRDEQIWPFRPIALRDQRSNFQHFARIRIESRHQGRVVAQLAERVKSLTVHLSVTGPKDRGLSNHEAASSNLAGSSTPIFGAHGHWPRATGHRSSTANERARRRRITSHCPTRAGRCGASTPRCGCDSRRSGHHLLYLVTRRETPSPIPRPRCFTVASGRWRRVIGKGESQTGSNPGSPVSSLVEWVDASRLSIDQIPWPSSARVECIPHLLDKSVGSGEWWVRGDCSQSLPTLHSPHSTPH